MPPEPFLYRIDGTPYIIRYTNYGSPIPLFDALELIADAQEDILDELSRIPSHHDIIQTETRIWAKASARLTVTPTPMMRYSTCALIFSGMVECGDFHGFVEADLEFLSVRDVLNPFGKGSLLLDR